MQQIMRSLVLMCASLALGIVSFAQAGEPKTCAEQALSKEATKKVKAWQKRYQKRYLSHQGQTEYAPETVRAELVEAMSDVSFHCLDRAVFQAFVIQIDSDSPDASFAIPALELHLVQKTYPSADMRADDVTKLARHYRQKGRLPDLKHLIERELPHTSSQKAIYLREQLAITSVLEGELPSALETLEANLEGRPDSLYRGDLQLAAAIAIRLGDVETAQMYVSFVEANYPSFRAPRPVAGVEGDDLDHIIARWSMKNKEIMPIEPPRPSYPRRAAERGLTGACEVYFDVDDEGRPINVDAECTSSAFKSESVRALKAVRFSPITAGEDPRTRTGVMYPLEYKLGRRR